MNTIAQIATSIGEGAISIIKVSGKDSISTVNNCFIGKNLLRVKSHTLNYGYIVESDRKIDEVLVSVMRGPKTSTGEDVVEINCHGGILITQKILKLLVDMGIELAEPGEFSKRAFLNGKINLDEANNIINLIHAGSEQALELAITKLNYSTKNLIENLRQELLDIITNIEVNIDYPEYDDIVIVENKNISEKIDMYINKIQKVIIDSKKGELLTHGISTALIGTPNVGKSSILNYLSKKEKAIVTDIEGTTRDLIESNINLGEINIKLIDTAGIRDTDNEIEKYGIDKSYEQVLEAQLILFIVDSSRKINENEIKLYKKLKNSNKNVIILLNKIDKKIDNDFEFLNFKKVEFSALLKKGEEELEKSILKLYDLESINYKNLEYINDLNILTKLENIEKKLKEVKNELTNNQFIDIILIDLKECLFILGDLIGINVKEDYLNEIFSRFCLGK